MVIEKRYYQSNHGVSSAKGPHVSSLAKAVGGHDMLDPRHISILSDGLNY